MATSWTSDQLRAIEGARELEIATARPDGTLRRWTPIWAVTAGGSVYVRTWVRRTTGWYGHAVETRRARVRVPGLEADVTVEDVGTGDATLRSAVDAAYQDKYGGGDGTVSGMITDETASTTLRLVPATKASAPSDAG